jgi:Aerobic-type carbon monoxide dehydrogenase, small subunit CoxS/CutS homologs
MPSFTLNVNGEPRTIEVRDPDEPLLYVLRNSLALTGAKFGCGLGQCGACTVIVDNDAVRSCRMPVSKAAGRRITTIEGLGTPGTPHPLQAAFVADQAAQCGYCVTGMVMSGAAALARKPNLSRDDAQQALAGNLCRCGTHDRILRAMLRASGERAA